jgi:hypothetical protein
MYFLIMIRCASSLEITAAVYVTFGFPQRSRKLKIVCIYRTSIAGPISSCHSAAPFQCTILLYLILEHTANLFVSPPYLLKNVQVYFIISLIRQLILIQFYLGQIVTDATATQREHKHTCAQTSKSTILLFLLMET